MVIIDAQIHVWSPDVSTRPWLPGTTPRAHCWQARRWDSHATRRSGSYRPRDE